VATGPGSSSTVTTAALARYTPLLLGNGPAFFDRQAPLEGSGDIQAISIAVATAADDLSATTNYSYTLQLKAGSRTINATAASPFGVAYVLETLTQLLDNATTSPRLLCSSVDVSDAPQFEHRGLMIDSGRRFYPYPVVKTFVDGLAASKMNVLHLFLSEACFRVESKVFPQLTEPGSCFSYGMDNTAFYTQAEIKELVQYAYLRGVRVLPEFDQPGHAKGFCETLGPVGLQCCGTQIEDDAAGKSVKIMKALMTEMASLFPEKVMSIGSDETGGCGNVTAYEVKMIEHVLSLGKTPMGWQEIQLKTNASTNFPSVVVENWGGPHWDEVAATGHRTINANKLLFYLDYVNHQAEPMWTDLHGNVSNTTQRALLIGGETAHWGDAFMTGSCLYSNSQDVNYSRSVSQTIWPRTAIAAGAFWGHYRPVPDDYLQATLVAVQSRLAGRGVDSCPCATTTTNGCSQTSQCGVSYCPPAPAPLPPAPPCAAYESPVGFLCLGATAGAASLLIKTEQVDCTGSKPLGCAKSAAAKCGALENCAAFTITGGTARFYTADPQPPIPAAATKTLLAMACNAADPNQEVIFTPSDAGGSSGLLVAPGGMCVDLGCDPATNLSRFVAPVPLTPCKEGTAGQTWQHDPRNGTFMSVCTHDPKDPHGPRSARVCIDVSCGGMKTADVTASWSCDDPAAMQNSSKDGEYGTWRQYGRTFREVRDGKCLSIGNDAAGGHPFIPSAASVSWMKSKGAVPTKHD
jgi:hexosaminidase